MRDTIKEKRMRGILRPSRAPTRKAPFPRFLREGETERQRLIAYGDVLCWRDFATRCEDILYVKAYALRYMHYAKKTIVHAGVRVL